jgi:hypothetical protein
MSLIRFDARTHVTGGAKGTVDAAWVRKVKFGRFESSVKKASYWL